jgi:hypothetical protein
MLFTGQSEDGNRMEIMELKDHPYYVGVQYHPEYLARPTNPSAPFVGFILAACSKLQSYMDNTLKKRQYKRLDSQCIHFDSTGNNTTKKDRLNDSI